MEYGKPQIGNPIPDKYKVTVEELDQRLGIVEKQLNIIPSIPKHFENENTAYIEHNGCLIYRNLSSRMYKALDINAFEIPRLSDSEFNQLDRCKSAIDSYISAKQLMEDKDNARQANQ